MQLAIKAESSKLEHRKCTKHLSTISSGAIVNDKAQVQNSLWQRLDPKTNEMKAKFQRKMAPENQQSQIL